MDPRARFRRNPECPARGEGGEGSIGIRSRKERRYRRKRCGRTFAGARGTPVYRLHKPSELFFLVVTLLSHGCPAQAIAAAFGLDERTVSDWLSKAGIHCQQVHRHPVKAVQPGCVQADELRVRMVGRKVRMAMAMAVSSRLWLGGAVGANRDGRLVGTLARMVRAAAESAAVLVMTDGFEGYVGAFRGARRRPVYTGRVGRPRLAEEPGSLMGQAVKRYSRRRVAGVAHRAAVGAPEAIEAKLRAAGGGDVVNTACIERLNATFRGRLVGLVRRTRALARRGEPLEAGMWLVGGVYNFCAPHHSLRVEADSGRKWIERTPAMAAGLADHVWSIEELLGYRVPPPQQVAPKRRGRPPRQTQPPARRLAA